MPFGIGIFLIVAVAFVAIVYKFFDSIGWAWLIAAIVIILWVGKKVLGAMADVRLEAEQTSREEQAATEKMDAESRAKRKERQRKLAEKRHQELLEKYGDEEVVARILAKDCWLGQTAEQLLDALGSPEDTDTKKTSRLTREVWKYKKIAANRHALKITVSNNEVTAIDDKR